MEIWMRIFLLEVHENPVIDENRHLELLVTLPYVEIELCQARESADRSGMNDTKVELPIVKEAMRASREWPFVDIFLMLGAAADCNSRQEQLAIKSKKLHIEDSALTSGFDQLKKKMTAVCKQLKQNYICRWILVYRTTFRQILIKRSRALRLVIWKLVMISSHWGLLCLKLLGGYGKNLQSILILGYEMNQCRVQDHLCSKRWMEFSCWCVQ